MDEDKINKYTIDFTDEDKISLYTKQIADWWLEDAHPEISVRARKIALELLQQETEGNEKEVDHSGN
jgi:hypothetical protein